MTFNSLSFFLFLPLVFLLFSAVSDRHRWLVLLLASYLFYGFILKPVLLLALTAVIVCTFRIGWRIDQCEDPAARRGYLWLGVLLNLALLIYFKYLPFITENLASLSESCGIDIYIPRPVPQASVGVSFYIFQAISYLADIYFRTAKPEEHLGHFGLYMAFFPKLLQGPIERASSLIPQIKERYRLDYDNLRFGMALFAWGLFKKVVIADRLGPYVDAVYDDVHAFSGVPLLLATYAYAFQLYMDFSGYTDMALGTARLFNIKLTQNFNSPYLANSVADFWRRWHITLSRWILNYVFEPLQMTFRNLGKPGTVAALVVTFVLVGIWHGANWTFITFGLIHGIYLGAASLYRPYQKKLHRHLRVAKSTYLKVWQVLVTFNLVSLTFAFIRASTVRDATYVVTNMLNAEAVVKPGFSLTDYAWVVVAAGIGVFLIETITAHLESLKRLALDKWYVRWAAYYALVLGIVFFGVSQRGGFIYFTF